MLEFRPNLPQDGGVGSEEIDHPVDDVVEVEEVVRMVMGDLAIAAHRASEDGVADVVDVDLLLVDHVQRGEKRAQGLAIRAGAGSGTEPIETDAIAAWEPHEVGGDESRLTGLVHDLENPAAGISFAEDLQAVGVNGADVHVAERGLFGDSLLDTPPDAVFEFGGSVFGEGKRDDGSPRNAVLDHASGATCERFGLAAAGTRKYEEIRGVARVEGDGLALVVGEVLYHGTARMAVRSAGARARISANGTALPICVATTPEPPKNEYCRGKVWIRAASRGVIARSWSGWANLPRVTSVQPVVSVGATSSQAMRP